MDCEKFEPLLLDELYEELDEVTSAAVKRHVSGCARCASVLNGMRSTRRLAALPMLELPAGLEDRILSSVKEAQKVVPLFGRAVGAEDPATTSRASRALSWAGSWAMRPQTAMAAVFLLMIGTSAFVIRSRHASSGDQQAAVSVTEQGIPAGQAPGSDDHDSLDNKAAAAAHGPNQPAPITAPPVATVAAGGSPVASAAGQLALNGDPAGGSVGLVDGLTAGKGRAVKEEGSIGSALAPSAGDGKDKNDEAQGFARRGAVGSSNAGPTGNAVAAGEKKSAPVARSPRPSDISNAGVPGGAAYAQQDDYGPRSQTIAPPATKAPSQDPQDGYSAGMAAYRARNYGEATRQFDGAARSGDQNSALWAAKAVRDGNGGCGAAIPRFDAVTQKAPGTYAGAQAQLESAQCQVALGQLDAARDKLTKLTNVPSHAAAAQQALNDLNQVAQKREAERAKSASGAGGGAGNARPAAAAPARAAAKPSAPAATAADKANAADANKASGF